MYAYSRHVVALCITVILCSGGCQSGSRPPKPAPAPKVETDAHKDHDHDHDGLLFHDANERYHLRVEIDAAKKEVEARVLDENAKEPAPLAADALTLTIKNGKPHQVALKAQRAEGKRKPRSFAAPMNASRKNSTPPRSKSASIF